MKNDPTGRDFVGITHANRETLTRYYDDWAASYDDDMPGMGYEAPAEVTRLIAEAGVAYEAALLDAGCGTGLIGQALAEAGYRAITGIDQSAAMLGQAQAKDCYSALIQQDLNQALPLADNVFAGATLVATLTYIDNAAGLLAELCRVVSAGGPIVLTHRDDLYDADFVALVEKLEDEGRWVCGYHSAPADFIPGHPQFGSDTGIHYDVYRVR